MAPRPGRRHCAIIGACLLVLLWITPGQLRGQAGRAAPSTPSDLQRSWVIYLDYGQGPSDQGERSRFVGLRASYSRDWLVGWIGADFPGLLGSGGVGGDVGVVLKTLPGPDLSEDSPAVPVRLDLALRFGTYRRHEHADSARYLSASAGPIFRVSPVSLPFWGGVDLDIEVSPRLDDVFHRGRFAFSTGLSFRPEASPRRVGPALTLMLDRRRAQAEARARWALSTSLLIIIPRSTDLR